MKMSRMLDSIGNGLLGTTHQSHSLSTQVLWLTARLILNKPFFFVKAFFINRHSYKSMLSSLVWGLMHQAYTLTHMCFKIARISQFAI